jgi:outer membrane immunogenic protein
MRKIILGSIACVSLAAGPALAADLPVKAPIYKAPDVLTYNWTGFYIGVNAVAGWARSNWDFGPFSTGGFTYSGGGGGLQGGYNYQALGSPLVFGVEATIDWTSFRGSTTTFCPVGCQTSNTYLGTFEGRIGVAWDRALGYVHGGLAYGSIRSQLGGVVANTDTRVGWTGGVGVDYAVTNNIIIGLQYDHVDLRGGTCTLPVCDLPAQINHTLDEIRFRVSLTWDQSVIPRGSYSDARLKTDIVALGHLENGLAIYRFRYADSDEVFVGVMAQEVALVRPDAVTLEDGYLLVDYERLGLRMQTWEEWSTSGQTVALVSEH